MPSGDVLYADELVRALEKKYAGGTGYKSVVIYLESCDSGSMFEGILPRNLSVYATTASNKSEYSWGAYCPGDDDGAPPSEYTTCLGDLYSVSWMEDSDAHSLRTESIKQQFDAVKLRTSAHGTYKEGSHVMEYGDVDISAMSLSQFMGSDRPNDKTKFVAESFSSSVNQWEADVLHFRSKYRTLAAGSAQKEDAGRQLTDLVARRSRVDSRIQLIGELLFGSEEGPKVLNAVRSAGRPLVDDWECLRRMMRSFEACEPLTQYGMRYTRALANICNAGVREEAKEKAASQACRRGRPRPSWGP
jgi:legumain